MMTAEALQELIAVVSDQDFESDPVGMLKAWAGVAGGDVTPDDRYRPTELVDFIACEPSGDELSAKLARLSPEALALLERWIDVAGGMVSGTE